MHYIKFLFIGLFASFLIWSVHSAGYVQKSGWITPECTQASGVRSKSYSFNKVYHGDLSEMVLTSKKDKFFSDWCALHLIFGVDVTSLSYLFVPVYHPKWWPIGFYGVYSGKYLSWLTFFTSSAFRFDWQWLRISGLHSWTMFRFNQPNEKNSEAYLKSLQPPFSTAHTVQWYVYLWRPLLVARNADGLVTDVFIQNFRSIKDPREIAQKYLWEKWYHP